MSHAIGSSTYHKPRAYFETKPPNPPVKGSGRSQGYERWRSWELRPDKFGERKGEVYVYVHRLAAVAWKFDEYGYGDECDMAGLLEELDGTDIHHEAPEAPGKPGVPWDNREESLHARSHGRHSEITQAQQRAWAETAKERAFGEPEPDRCPECHEPIEMECSIAAVDSPVCLDCAISLSDDERIEVLG